MQTGVPSIILISADPQVADAVSSALRGSDNVAFERCEGTLAGVNGKAVRMAEDHDLVVFQLNAETDPAAVVELREKVRDRGRLLALSDAAISLADALDLKRLGIDEILPFPVSPDVLREQMLKMTLRDVHLPALHEPTRIGQVIAVCPARGGIGASTFAVNLADQLQDRSGMIHKVAANRVALVDLDLQFGSVASALDLDASDTLYRLATEGIVPDQTFIDQSMVEHVSGLTVLTAPERFLPLDALRRTQVDALVGNLQRKFDYVVIDLPRTLVDWIDPVLARCARLLMVTDTTVPSIRQTHRMIEFFSESRFDLPVEIVVNLEKKPMIQASHHTEAAKVLERPLKHWLPNDSRHARAALDRGQVLSQAAGSAPLTHAIRKIARSIIKETRGAAEARPAKS